MMTRDHFQPSGYSAHAVTEEEEKAYIEDYSEKEAESWSNMCESDLEVY